MRAWVWVTVLAAAPVFGQGRPDEASMFGSEDAVVDAGAPPETAGPSQPAPAADDRDAQQLGSGPIKSRFDTEEEKSNPLQIGGSFLTTAQATVRDHTKFKDIGISAPSVLDAYLDARPNDRLRAFVVARLQYDPTQGSTPATAGLGAGAIGTTTSTSATNPSVALDQLWLAWDLNRRVFFTLGRQKVRWGVGRIWYPTDFLNNQPKDPFNPFDVRLGVNMLKVHVPIESLGWNFYGYGLIDNRVNASTLGQLSGALRAQVLLGPAELGLGGVWALGRYPRYGADISAPLGPVDVYAEAAIRDGHDFTTVSFPNGVDVNNPFLTRAEFGRDSGIFAQATGGVSWTFNYTEKNTGTVSLEYFYNPRGYTNPVRGVAQMFVPALYPNVSFDITQTNLLYQAQQYLGISAVFAGLPELPKVTATASAVVNMIDPSGLVRVDLIFRVLTYLTIQVYGSAFFGSHVSQLHFGFDQPIVIPGRGEVSIPATNGQFGALLRLAI